MLNEKVEFKIVLRQWPAPFIKRGRFSKKMLKQFSVGPAEFQGPVEHRGGEAWEAVEWLSSAG